MLVGRTARIERTQQVDIDDRLESVGRHAGGCSREIASGGAQHEVDLSKFAVRLLHRGVHRVVVADIGGESSRDASLLANRGGRGVELVLPAPYQHDFRTVFGITFGDALPDAATASGYESDSVLQQVRLEYGHEVEPAYPAPPPGPG